MRKEVKAMSSHSVTNSSDVYVESRNANAVRWTLYVPTDFEALFAKIVMPLRTEQLGSRPTYFHEI
jgi:hypothetical protein